MRGVSRPCFAFALLGLLLSGACGAPPAPKPSSDPPPEALGKRRTDIPDDCAQLPGQPPPEPLRIPYDGVAKGAPCQRAVYTIMGGLTHFLGVECRHCHLEPDYAADTHNKQIANWMARELVPRLQKRKPDADGSRDVWCQDCHAGKPKFLGDPRRRDFAIEWMTTHLVEDFNRVDPAAGAAPAKPSRCKDCHGGDLGSPEFRSKIILSDLATGAMLPPPAAPAAPAPPAASPAPSAQPPTKPVPDFGGR